MTPKQSKKELGYTAVLYSKEDAINFLEDQPRAERVYPITPEARAQLLGKTGLPVLDPLNYFKDYSHRRIIARVRRIEKTLHPMIYKENNLSGASKETYRALFHSTANMVFYLWYLLRGTGPWLICHNKSWHYCDDLEKAHRILVMERYTQGIGIFRAIKIPTLSFSFLYKLINSWVMLALNQRSTIWVNSTQRGLKDLIKHIITVNNKTRILYLSKIDENESGIKYFMRMIIAIILRENEIAIIPTPHHKKSVNIPIQQLKEIDDSIIQNVLDILSTLIVNTLDYTESFVDCTFDLMRRSRALAYLSISMRWRENAVLGEAAKINGIKSILISHGSHSLSYDMPARYEQKEHAQGLLTSHLATESIIQSVCAEKAAREFMPDLKRQAFQPMIWGHKSIKEIKENKRIRTILHAGTYKFLAQRPWIYETSNEFLKGLKQLVKAVSNLDNTRLIIRVRPNLECSLDSFRKLLPVNSKTKIKTSGNFLDDLSEADLLISFSSTTIEEALYARKPVGLFGGSDRYRHLPSGSGDPPSTKNRSAVYNLSKQNLAIMLNSILHAHAFKPLTDEELNGYIWPLNVPGRDDFVDQIFKINQS